MKTSSTRLITSLLIVFVFIGFLPLATQAKIRVVIEDSGGSTSEHSGFSKGQSPIAVNLINSTRKRLAKVKSALSLSMPHWSMGVNKVTLKGPLLASRWEFIYEGSDEKSNIYTIRTNLFSKLLVATESGELVFSSMSNIGERNVFWRIYSPNLALTGDNKFVLETLDGTQMIYADTTDLLPKLRLKQIDPDTDNSDALMQMKGGSYLNDDNGGSRLGSTAAQQLSTKTNHLLINTQVFPNPATNGNMTITNSSLFEADEISVFIYNTTGKIVMKSATQYGKSNRIPLDVSTLEPGVYLLRITTDKGGAYTKRIAIE